MKFKNLYNTSEKVSAIGQGAGFGNFLAKYSKYESKHIDAFRYGIELGMTFIDTAEEYGMGGSEKALSIALKGIRDKVFLASKVSSNFLDYSGVIKSANESLARLKTDYIDLYQIHWSNPLMPLEETIKAMDKLLKDGKIRYVGVCNLTLDEIKKVREYLSKGQLVSIQAEYNLVDRTIEDAILPYCEKNNLLTIAYSPLIQGGFANGIEKLGYLAKLAEFYNKTIPQIILNWLISRKTVITIPHSSNPTHIKENAESADFELSQDSILKINDIFTPKIIKVIPLRIRIYEKSSCATRVYKTKEEAIENKFNMVPSPVVLAEDIKNDKILKPIKVRPSADSTGKYDYDLAEGRLRYWAWIIANGSDKPIDVLLCE